MNFIIYYLFSMLLKLGHEDTKNANTLLLIREKIASNGLIP